MFVKNFIIILHIMAFKGHSFFYFTKNNEGIFQNNIYIQHIC